MTISDRREKGQKLLGDLLLKGYIMLDEVCSKNACLFPLMQKNRSSEALCVVCDAFPIPNEPEEMVIEQELVSSHETKKPDPSEKLGELLLKGWTMTNQTCSTNGCPVPLMRSRSGVYLCVECGDETYVTEKTADPEAPKNEEVLTMTEYPKLNEKAVESGKTEVVAPLDDFQKQIEQNLKQKLVILSQWILNETSVDIIQSYCQLMHQIKETLEATREL